MYLVIIFFVIHWYSSLFFQTFFHHRYSAHRQFTMSKFWEKVFYIGSFIFQGSSYLSPWAYAILHRLHHAYADTDKDPHSPKFSRNIFSLMWKTKKYYARIFKDLSGIPENFKKNLPEWKVFDNIADSYVARIAWVLVYIFLYWQFSAPLWMYFIFLPIQVVMGPFHGAIINWYAHRWGYVNHASNDTSKNLLPLDILMLGEAYHNNHHKYPSRPNFGLRWHELDPVYPIILFFNWLGIIRLIPQKVPTLK
ncbi:MAG: acyl-CoA desaturase [Bacteroidia bacterium]|nr:acyl-CoA desaturase [Bacteroidia bacterium]MDW8157984.1 acyl-CoA desaturase [Bacteroidia bacterium]